MHFKIFNLHIFGEHLIKTYSPLYVNVCLLLLFLHYWKQIQFWNLRLKNIAIKYACYKFSNFALLCEIVWDWYKKYIIHIFCSTLNLSWRFFCLSECITWYFVSVSFLSVESFYIYIDLGWMMMMQSGSV